MFNDITEFCTSLIEAKFINLKFIDLSWNNLEDKGTI